jgi:regulator of telomere elongation helicase 1
MLEEDNSQNNFNEKENEDKTFINPTNIEKNNKETNITKDNIIKRQIIHINQNKLKKQKKLIIEGIEIYFPYNPYEKQITYMTSIIQVLNKKYNSSEEINFNALAALESPTGTGKTLCLLCSLLAWVNTKGKAINFSGTIFYSTRTHSQISQVISELNKTCYEPRIAILSSREFSCANTELKKSLATSVLDIKCAREHKNCRFYKNIEYYSNKNFGNVDIEDILKQGKAKIFCPFYVERMKVKMSNCDLVFMPYNYIFLKEIRESMDIDLKKSILVIDEAHNVVNNCEEAQTLEITIKDFEEMIIDLNEVYKEIKKNKKYTDSNIIIEENEQNLDDNNYNYENKNGLIYTLRFEFLMEEIKLIKNIIESVTSNKEKFEEQKFSKDNNNYIQINPEIFLSIFLKTEDEIKELKQKEKKNQLTLESCFNQVKNKDNDTNKEFVEISQYLTEQNIIKHILFIKRIIKAIMNDYSRRTKLSILLNLFEKINEILEDKNITKSYVYCLSDDKVQTNHHITKKIIKLNIFCFNPGLGFKDIINFKPYSIIMTSGTLAPFDVLENELKVKFDVTLENEHIIPESQYKFVIIKGYEIYDKLFPFNFEYTNRNDNKTIASLGMTILHLCKAVKNGGILVYFTSFSYLNQCYRIWGDCNIISQISQIKTIYFDDKKNKTLIKDFKNNKNKNSILLSVFRGTSSEGIDFRDEFARMVICVGVPYASIVEEKVQLKKKYLDEINKSNIIEGLTGRKWYLNDAISNVNQSLGRVLRHINDYGILVCIDERYEYKNIKNLFSNWIRNKCEVIKSINDNFFDSLEQFFNEQEEKFKTKEEENIINNNENNYITKEGIEENQEDSNTETKNKTINSLIDNAFKRRKKEIIYGYEESEEPDDDIQNNKEIIDINEKDNNDDNNINDKMNNANNFNCEKELENLNNKYLKTNNIKETILLNKKTNPERNNIQNNEDINPNILNNSNIKKDEENLIQQKEKEKYKDKHLKIKEEHINIKNEVNNFATEINNYKFDDFMEDFNKKSKIIEMLKKLDENENTKTTTKELICCVCYEISSDNKNLNYSLSKCNHLLCNKCWAETLNVKLECPICRKKTRAQTLKRLIRIEGSDNINEKINNDEKI